MLSTKKLLCQWKKVFLLNFNGKTCQGKFELKIVNKNM